MQRGREIVNHINRAEKRVTKHRKELNMAENENTVETQATEVESNEELETLRAELEKSKAESARFKSAIDKLTKEAAEKKREERAKMSAEEQARAERDEEYTRLKEKAEADAKELNHLKAVTAYKSIESEIVEKLIGAIDDKDHNAIAGYINKIVEKAIKEKEAEWKKSRPDAVVGNGAFPTMTKEQIMAIPDEEEMIRQIALHKELFEH